LNVAEHIALGTVQFGLAYGVSNTTGQVSMQEVRRIFDEAKDCGIDTLDTAIAYGESETVLGQLGVGDWRVVSKLPALPTSADNVVDWVLAQFTASLHRLGVSHLEGLLLHRPEQLNEPGGGALWAALQELREQGLVRRIGVSIYSHEELPALTAGRRFDLVQAPLNILDRSLVDSGWAQRLKEQGVELHVRSAFLQGLLLMGPDRPDRFARWQPLWQQWHAWLDQHGLSPLQACLRYGLSLPQVDRVVVGVESVAQLREIVDAAQGDLPPPPDWCMPVDSMLANPAKWSLL
jgi:aryl-alcohol dehydrogenase-like predicted oxidoreductase